MCILRFKLRGGDDYSRADEALGLLLVKRGIGLVYGGGNVGLMGEIASVVIKARGGVTGVIPRALANREMILVDSDAESLLGKMEGYKPAVFDKAVSALKKKREKEG